MTNHTLGSQHLDKCGHGGCKCLVDPGHSYCSEKCEHADIKAEQKPQDPGTPCSCGHPDCK